MASSIVVLALLIALAYSVSSQSEMGHFSSTATVQVQTIITGLASASLRGVAASVVSADPCRTTLAMHCTDGNICAAARGLQMNVTQGSGFYEVAYSSSTSGGGFEASQLCTLRLRPSCAMDSLVTGSTQNASDPACLSGTEAYSMGCSMKATVVVQSRMIARNTEVTGLYNYPYVQIPITAGAEKLPPTGATCVPTAWPTSNTTRRPVPADYTISSEARNLVPPSLGTRQIAMGGVVLFFAHLAQII